MKYLKHMTVVKYENLLIQRLCLGGDVRDATGKNLVGQQVLAVWNEPEIRDVCAAHSITMEALCQIYAACIERLMPNPCVKVHPSMDRLMLVPALFLLEDWRLQELFDGIAALTTGSPPDQKIEDYKEGMVAAARQLQTVHDAARGPAQFLITQSGGLPVSASDPVNRRPGCGCAGVLLLFLALASMGLVIVLCLAAYRTP